MKQDDVMQEMAMKQRELGIKRTYETIVAHVKQSMKELKRHPESIRTRLSIMRVLARALYDLSVDNLVLEKRLEKMEQALESANWLINGLINTKVGILGKTMGQRMAAQHNLTDESDEEQKEGVENNGG